MWLQNKNCYRSTFAARLSRALTGLLAIACFELQAAPAAVEDVRLLARLYSAAFDREPKSDGLNFWVEQYESGKSVVAIAQRFYQSPEFAARYGDLSHEDFVRQLFRNVLGREGNSSGINFWVKHLINGTSRAQVLAEFAGSRENAAKTAITFADMRYEAGRWVFRDDPGAPPFVAGNYALDAGAMRYQCNTGEKGLAQGYHSTFGVKQADTALLIENSNPLILAGVSISSTSGYRGKLYSDGAFTASQSARGYAPVLDSELELEFKLTGAFEDGAWQGEYSYAVAYTGQGRRCTYSGEFSGPQVIAGVSQSPGGIWRGPVFNPDSGSAYDAVVFSTQSGEIRFITLDGEQAAGTLTVKEDQFDASLVYYATRGSAYDRNGLPYSAASGSGILLQQSAINGEARVDGIIARQFNLAYTTLYDRPSSLALIAGEYLESTALGVTKRFTIDSRGRMSGVDINDCRYSGQVSIVDSRYNMYRVALVLSNCLDRNGPYSGLAVLADDGGRRNDSVLLSASGAIYPFTAYATRN